MDKIDSIIQPLDVILFRGVDKVSKLISKIEKYEVGNGDWTHVGIAVSTDVLNIKNGIPGEIYVWESTAGGRLGDGVFDVESNNTFVGVQIRSLKELITNYRGKIAVAKLVNNPYPLKTKELRNTLSKIHQEFYHRGYDFNVINLLAAASKKFRALRDKFACCSRLQFCSEFISRVYVDLNILKSSTCSENVLPMDLLGLDKDNDIPKGLFKSPHVLKA